MVARSTLDSENNMKRPAGTRPARTAAPDLDPVDAIVAVNRGRNPQLMARKFDAMAGDPFVFLRATALLGHRALDLGALPPAPLGWVCGDLHVQNFGCFRGANRLVYFDLNDFDEAARLPVVVDLTRLLASILCAAPGMGLDAAQGRRAALAALTAYAQALARGKAMWFERETATGAVRRLLGQVSRRDRRSLLAGRSKVVDGRRRLRIDGQHYLAMPEDPALRAGLVQALGELGQRFELGGYFKLRDLAIRVAGMGSLGVARYVALVRGKADPDRNALVDFKLAVGSSAIAALPTYKQPDWGGEAARVVGVQDLCQAASPAFLTGLQLCGRPFVARELQPVEDRVALELLVRHLGRLDQALAEMGRLGAYAQLRSAGRLGADSADALVDFGRMMVGQPRPWLEAARAVNAANEVAFKRFRRAWTARDPRLATMAAPPPGDAAHHRAARSAMVKLR